MSNNLTLAEVVPVLSDLQIKLTGKNGDQVFSALKKILRGEEIQPEVSTVMGSSMVIDFDSTPYIPDGCKILHDSGQFQNRVKGEMEYDYAKVMLHLDDDQKGGNVIKGSKLRKSLKDVPVFGAQLLDFYLVNRHFIPGDWKGKAVHFWGTIYCDDRGLHCVRCLCWGSGGWYWGYSSFSNSLDSRHPALVSASYK